VIKNILIDLDGTLTDPKVGITTCVRYGLEKIGHPIAADLDLDWVIGPPLKASLAKLLNVSVENDLAEQAILGYRERFSTIGLFENDVFPDVADTLAKMQQAGFKLFLATAKPIVYAEQILEHFDLLKYFSKAYGSELDGTRTNKAELIHYILQQENLQAAECIMIGDREHDILGARKNGIETIAVEYGYGTDVELTTAQPLHRIAKFSDVLLYL